MTSEDNAEIHWADMAEGIRQRDDRSIEQFYAVFAEGFRYRLLRQLGPDGLDDHVQTALITVIEAVQRGQLQNPERLAGFANTIVRRHIAQQMDIRMAERKKTSEPGVFDAQANEPNPEQLTERAQVAEIMRKVLAALGPQDKEVLRRFYVLGQSEAEIRTAMAIGADQFRNLKWRAKAKFVSRWRAYCEKHRIDSREAASEMARD